MATNNQDIDSPSDHDCLESAFQPNRNTPFPILCMAKNLQLKTAKDNNFVFSPFSIQLAMSLIAHGANGSTLDELLTFLQVENLDQLTSVASKLVATLSQPQPVPDDPPRGHKRKFASVDDDSSDGDWSDDSPPVFDKAHKLTLVGGAWIDHSLCLSPSFISCAENVYKVKAEAVNFKDQGQEVVDKVNKWAEESTYGRIKSVLPGLSPDTILVIANAVHFKGTWRYTFDESCTRDSDFYLHNGETVKVPFMCDGGEQFIENFDDFKVLKLPYIYKDYGEEARLSMYIILPHQRDGLWNLVDKVGSDPHFLEKYTTNNRITVEVRKLMVPKFKMTSEFEASEFLKGVGLKSCFSMEAEFHNMLLNPKLKGPVYVSQVHHKSFIEVNEGGTEAAAVTVLVTSPGYCPSSPPYRPVVDFVADHPFMFMIKDDRSGMVLFLGHVINPLLE